MGCKTRAIKLLEYFKDRGFDVDFVGLEGWDDWSVLNKRLFTEIYLLKEEPIREKVLKRFFTFKVPRFIFKSKNKLPKGALPDQTTYYLKKSFDDLLKKKTYDFIIISYAYWANLIKDNPNLGQAKTIIDTHDFLTSQQQSDEGIILGTAFEEEIKRLSLFDEIWVVSIDERYIFSQFLSHPVVFIPITFKESSASKAEYKQIRYDLLYVGSDNYNNINAINWFFEKVFPLLSENIRICIVGKVASHIPDNKNVTKIPFATNLDSLYLESRIALCPMLAGTGVKIKVVEALSYGLPVVCTSRGIDGLPNKNNNGCLISDDPKEFASNITSLMSDEIKYEEHKSSGLRFFRSVFRQDVGYRILDQALNSKKEVYGKDT